MPQYSVITREDEQSELLKDKIIHFLTEYNYTYDEKKKAGRFVLSGDASMIQKMLAILQES